MDGCLTAISGIESEIQRNELYLRCCNMVGDVKLLVQFHCLTCLGKLAEWSKGLSSKSSRRQTFTLHYSYYCGKY